MIREELQHLAIDIDQLHPHPRNVRQGDVGAISESLRIHGQYRTIVYQQSSNRILAGNHTWKAAKALGWKQIAATPIICDDDQALRILLADNKANDLATYDDKELLDLLKELAESEAELEGTLFDGDELDALVEETAHYELPSDVDDVQDDVPAVSKLGDVWLLGEHRLMCGDSLIGENLDLLMNGKQAGCVLTDPPYGINLDTDYTKLPAHIGTTQTKHKKVIGDDKPFDAKSIYEYFADTKEQFWFGADYYRRTIPEADTSGSWLVWDKRTETTDSGFGSGFELCWSKTRHKRDLLRHLHFGMFTVEKGKRVHPTQKPVVLLIDILNRWVDQGAIVVDLFGGSGSTLIAAEETNRIAYLMELDPHYVDVICARYQKHTGNLPILEATGEPHNFTDATE